jgi:hypothetical protein
LVTPLLHPCRIIWIASCSETAGFLVPLRAQNLPFRATAPMPQSCESRLKKGTSRVNRESRESSAMLSLNNMHLSGIGDVFANFGHIVAIWRRIAVPPSPASKATAS